MTNQQIADLEIAKARIKATWMAGDYARIAQFTDSAARKFIARRQIRPGMRVLDVACGTGNLAIPAAKAGAVVTGVDIAPNLLEQARARAAREFLDIMFETGDAECLPCQASGFDLVVSMFGASFAPRPDFVARELTRVCRPGGQIAMANWTSAGFIGELFKVTGKHVAAPAGVPSPLLWGDEVTVRERLDGQVTDVRMMRTMAQLKFPVLSCGYCRVLSCPLRSDTKGLRRPLRECASGASARPGGALCPAQCRCRWHDGHCSRILGG
jgi:SAM-dependent methyltransferase